MSPKKSPLGDRAKTKADLIDGPKPTSTPKARAKKPAGSKPKPAAADRPQPFAIRGLDPDLIADLKTAASAKGETIASFVARAIRREMERKETKDAVSDRLGRFLE